jgi:peptidoglycan/LPS O-acetylase OafA/YrhL
MKSKELANLDIMRSFAVLTVMLEHLVRTIERSVGHVPPGLLTFTAHIGQTGVLAFFVHTSLVLMYSLERLGPRSSGSLATRFYVRRFFRIYPLSIACVVGVLALGIPRMAWEDTTTISGNIVAANLLLVQNLLTGQSVLGPLWSLPYEVQMYILLPSLFLIANGPRGVRNLLVLILLACAGAIALVYLADGRLNMAAFAPCFLCGVLCYALRNRQRAILPAKLWPWLLTSLILLYCQLHVWSGAVNPVYWIGWLLCAVLGLGINLFRDSMSPVVNRLANKLALYSYGLYLLHMPVLYLVFRVWHTDSVILACALYFSLSLLLSIVAYHLLENPLIDVGRRLSGLVNPPIERVAIA